MIAVSINEPSNWPIATSNQLGVTFWSLHLFWSFAFVKGFFLKHLGMLNYQISYVSFQFFQTPYDFFLTSQY